MLYIVQHCFSVLPRLRKQKLLALLVATNASWKEYFPSNDSWVWKTVIHFIQAYLGHFSIHLPPLPVIEGCHMGDTSAIQVRIQHNHYWFMQHKSRAQWDRLSWSAACQNTVRDGGLMAHSSMASASCCLHQLLFDRKEFFPAVRKDTAINLKHLTATHHGPPFLLFYNRCYW